MRYPSLSASIALVTTPFSAATPKSYTLVNYTGGGTDVKINFDYKEGWSQGSSITATIAGKKATFSSAIKSDSQFKFVQADKKTVITLKMDPDGKAPSRIEGTYSFGGKDVPITLAKSKK